MSSGDLSLRTRPCEPKIKSFGTTWQPAREEDGGGQEEATQTHKTLVTLRGGVWERTHR